MHRQRRPGSGVPDASAARRPHRALVSDGVTRCDLATHPSTSTLDAAPSLCLSRGGAGAVGGLAVTSLAAQLTRHSAPVIGATRCPLSSSHSGSYPRAGGG